MASTFFGLEIGKSGIQAHRRALDVVGHNIANANTEGYTKQRIELVARTPESPFYARPNSEGIVGMGVDVGAIRRVRDKFLDATIYREQGTFNEYETLRKYLDQIESIYNEPGDNNVRSLLDKFWEAFQNLSTDPENMDYRNQVINTADSLIKKMSDSYTMLSQMKQDLNNNIESTVSQINEYIKQIAELNGEIKSTEGLGFHANDLRDKRDLLVEKLSKLIDVQVYEDIDEFSIRAGEHNVVQGTTYSELKITHKSYDYDNFHLYWNDNTTSNKKNVYEQKVVQEATKEVSHSDSVAKLGVANANSSLAGLGINVGDTLVINNKTITLTDAGGGTVTLNSIANDINNTPNVGVRAYIDLDENGDQALFLESADSGFENTIIVEDTSSGVLQKIGYLNSDGLTKRHVTQTAQDEVVVPSYAEAAVNGGELAAYLKLRNEVIDKELNNLDELALNLINEVNKQHKLGYDLDGNQGLNFFEPYATLSRTSDTNHDLVDDVVNVYKIVGNVVDGNATIGHSGVIYINDKIIKYQSGDTYSDLVEKINSANAGVYASLEEDNFYTGKTRFTLTALRDDDETKSFRIRYLDDDQNNLLATLGVLNANTRFEYRHINKQYSIPRSETPGSSPYVILRHQDGIAQKIALNSAIANDVRKIAAAKWIDDGDNIIGGAGDASAGPGSGENANEIANLKHKAVFAGATQSFDDFIQNIAQEIGTAYQQADSVAQAHNERLNSLLDLRQQVSGVSLDEELTNMIKYQQGYNASARVITAIDEMLDVLINKVGVVGR